MKNNIADNTDAPLTTEPELVEAIVDVLTKDMEAIKLFLERKDLFENN